MTVEKKRKLNQLLRELPEGLLVDTAWLEGKDCSHSLRGYYIKSGWLEQPARGVYRRPAGKLLWQHVVISLQTLLERPILVGGRTALELHGFTHYLSQEGQREVHLYGDEKAPGWLFKLPLNTRFVFHNAKRLFRNEPITRGLGSLSWNLKNDEYQNTDPLHGKSFMQQPWGQWDWPLTLSSPERAVLELMDELPKRESFHQVDMLMEGLTSLSPRRLSKLIADCRNVKVKRLFLWFADRHQHAWFKRLDLDNVDLGRGKRQVAVGGRYDSKYQITVPENLDGGF
ncbi:MAG: type IV toxin-antitoxin system AbiEi family antitoxin [Rhodospirillales bacterium]|nr:type IV toxin-antitoxin system AbiEi family antitoxin [Rhodospirillales bacterium]